jgi:hypothetical protein
VKKVYEVKTKRKHEKFLCCTFDQVFLVIEELLCCEIDEGLLNSIIPQESKMDSDASSLLWKLLCDS